MALSHLESQRLALWGFGREGLAAWRALRARWPDKPLAVFCPAGEHAEITALGDPQLSLHGNPEGDALTAFDLVIKSPGISAYHPALALARAAGTQFSSGTALWFAQGLPGLKVCVTGTKGKSSTTALIAHLLRSRGLLVGLAGNIGLPLLELIDPPLMPAVWAIELSSYQTGDAQIPDVAVVLNLFPEHLDWHGSEQRYFEDKLALVTRSGARRCVLNHLDPRLRQLGAQRNDVLWFGHPDGWHVRDGSVWRGEQRWFDGAGWQLPGEHNLLNLCAALTAIEALDLDPTPLLSAAPYFQALPHRLQWLGERDGVGYINDSISTTPHASIAALKCQTGKRVAIIVGGHDRGLSWEVFADHVRQQPPALVITRGANGERIQQLLEREAPQLPVRHIRSLKQAVQSAREAVGAGGVVLLSPGAPSFGEFRDYAERGAAFARVAGFDDERAQTLIGLGLH